MAEGTFYEYDFSDQTLQEGAISTGGRPHIPPGPYKMALKEFEDGESKNSGNRRVHVKMAVVGGPEDGVELDDYFTLTVRKNGKKGVGWFRLQQWFHAMRVKSDGMIKGSPEKFADSLYGKQCVVHVRDEDEEAKPMVDDDGEPMLDDNGEPRMWDARLISRIDYYESLAKAEPKSLPSTNGKVKAAVPPAEPDEEEEEDEPAPPPKRAAAPAKAAAPKKAVAVAASADEEDDLFGDGED